MSSAARLRLLRFLEHASVVLLLVLVSLLAVLYNIRTLSTQELAVAGGIVALVLVSRWFIGRSIDEHYEVIVAQSEYTRDDAFAALFERSPVAYLIVNQEGKILETNPAAIKLLQAESDTLLRTNFFAHVDDVEHFDVTVLQGKIRAGMTLYDLEIPLHTFLGESIWVLLSVFTYRGEGQRLMALVDVTEQKHIDTAKSEFVALATHQLRTPIAAIRWNAELLRKNLTEPATDTQIKYLTKIDRNIQRMINLIDDFLSVSKLEMGTYATKEEATDLTEFVSGIVEEFAGRITEKELTLVRTDNPEHATILIDNRLLHIITSNVVSNAVKYLRPQGKIDVRYELNGATLTIVVADNGIGIPEGEVDKLFTKFYRASNAQSHRAEGTGLGLYIVKQSVELLGGHISVSAKEDEGARFEIVLPVRVVSL
jgi:two-component system phosphate regulon sensor histidine kinase PhoR